MKLSIDFAFAGFDIIRKNPVAVLLWGVVAMVFGVVASVLMVALSGPAIMALQAQGETPSPDPSQVFGQLGAMAPGWLIAVVIGLLSGAIIQCAVFRSQLRPGEGGFGFMKLGGDEFRQIAVTILYFVCFFIFYLLFALAVGILAVITRFLGEASSIAMIVVVIAAVLAFFYILSRWSLVLVQSYDERRINIFGSLKLTKGAGWTLFFGYLLLGIVMIIIMIVIYAILFGITMGGTLSNGGDLASAFQKLTQPDMTSVTSLFTLSFIIQTLIGGLVSGAIYAVMYGASVSAYQTLTAKNTSKADVF